MASIVKLKGSGKRAILIGVGYGKSATSRTSSFLGTAVEAAEESEMAAVSTQIGEILWCRSEDLTVVSIDGVTPAELLS